MNAKSSHTTRAKSKTLFFGEARARATIKNDQSRASCRLIKKKLRDGDSVYNAVNVLYDKVKSPKPLILILILSLLPSNSSTCSPSASSSASSMPAKLSSNRIPNAMLSCLATRISLSRRTPRTRWSRHCSKVIRWRRRPPSTRMWRARRTLSLRELIW